MVFRSRFGELKPEAIMTTSDLRLVPRGFDIILSKINLHKM